MDGDDGTSGNVHEPPLDNMKGGDDVCGSLEELLHPLPTIEELELPPHMCAIYNKHKEIFAIELKAEVRSFERLLLGMYCKRLALMLSEASKAGSRSDEAKYEGTDVTFDVPVAHADMFGASVTVPFAEPSNSDDFPGTTLGMDDATASDSNQPDGTTTTTDASPSGSSPQQQKQPDGTTSTTHQTVNVSTP